MLTVTYEAMAIIIGVAFLAGLISPLAFVIYVVMRAEVQ